MGFVEGLKRQAEEKRRQSEASRNWQALVDEKRINNQLRWSQEMETREIHAKEIFESTPLYHQLKELEETDIVNLYFPTYETDRRILRGLFALVVDIEVDNYYNIRHFCSTHISGDRFFHILCTSTGEIYIDSGFFGSSCIHAEDSAEIHEKALEKAYKRPKRYSDLYPNEKNGYSRSNRYNETLPYHVDGD